MVESKEEKFDFTKFAQLVNNQLDPKVKFNVLDMIDPRPFSTIDKLDPEKNSFTKEKLEKFLSPDDEYCEENNLDYMICDNFFEEFLQMTPEKANELLIGCRKEGMKLSKEGELREAGYGRQEEHKVSKKIRCDSLMWLTPLLK